MDFAARGTASATSRALFGLAIATILTGALFAIPRPAFAQSAESSLKQSCPDAARAFTLRSSGIEELAVADPSAPAKLRQAALLFYRCESREQDPYMRELFQAYYANSLYHAGAVANDSKAIALAMTAAQRLRSSQWNDVRALVATVTPPVHAQAKAQAAPAPTVTPALVHSNAYCQEFAPNMSQALQMLSTALGYIKDAGNNDVQVLAMTTARYGGAFKQVEDDYTYAQNNIGAANASLSSADAEVSDLNDQERTAAQNSVQALGTAITYADTYSRLALGFERGVNGANRQLARAYVSQALTSQSHNTSYTYTNGNVNCSSFGYSTNCYGNATSNTTYNNSAAIAQQNAANAVAQAQEGRLSYSQADEVLTQGLTFLNQLQTVVDSSVTSWSNVCK